MTKEVQLRFGTSFVILRNSAPYEILLHVSFKTYWSHYFVLKKSLI